MGCGESKDALLEGDGDLKFNGAVNGHGPGPKMETSLPSQAMNSSPEDDRSKKLAGLTDISQPLSQNIQVASLANAGHWKGDGMELPAVDSLDSGISNSGGDSPGQEEKKHTALGNAADLLKGPSEKPEVGSDEIMDQLRKEGLVDAERQSDGYVSFEINIDELRVKSKRPPPRLQKLEKKPMSSAELQKQMSKADRRKKRQQRQKSKDHSSKQIDKIADMVINTDMSMDSGNHSASPDEHPPRFSRAGSLAGFRPKTAATRTPSATTITFTDQANDGPMVTVDRTRPSSPEFEPVSDKKDSSIVDGTNELINSITRQFSFLAHESVVSDLPSETHESEANIVTAPTTNASEFRTENISPQHGYNHYTHSQSGEKSVTMINSSTPAHEILRAGSFEEAFAPSTSTPAASISGNTMYHSTSINNINNDGHVEKQFSCEETAIGGANAVDGSNDFTTNGRDTVSEHVGFHQGNASDKNFLSNVGGTDFENVNRKPSYDANSGGKLSLVSYDNESLVGDRLVNETTNANADGFRQASAELAGYSCTNSITRDTDKHFGNTGNSSQKHNILEQPGYEIARNTIHSRDGTIAKEVQEISSSANLASSAGLLGQLDTSELSKPGTSYDNTTNYNQNLLDNSDSIAKVHGKLSFDAAASVEMSLGSNDNDGNNATLDNYARSNGVDDHFSNVIRKTSVEYRHSMDTNGAVENVLNSSETVPSEIATVHTAALSDKEDSDFF